MSEKLYSWLLRLYPEHFRQKYGEEALQLFRDRSQHERGVRLQLRLWLDLLGDLAVTLPLQYSHPETAPAGGSGGRDVAWAPSFQVLEAELPRPGALLGGALFLLVALATIPPAIGHGMKYVTFSSWSSQPQARDRVRSVPAEPASSIPDNRPFSAGDTLGHPGTAHHPPPPKDHLPESRPQTAQSQVPLPPPPPTARQKSVQDDLALDAAKRQQVIARAIANLKKYYNYPDVAQKTADALLSHAKNGDDNGAVDGPALAELLTRQMKEVSHDGQLKVIYYRTRPVEPPPAPREEVMARYRATLQQNNCTFEKVEVLPHNIGYLKLNSFPDISICGSTARAAMASLNHVDAIIFDLRDNTGGYVNMVALIAGYLFDQPTHLTDLYDRAENSTLQSWTEPVPGNRLVNKPAYVLTSRATFSGAEEFSYDLKMLKRATLVGEATSGRGHIPRGRRIDEHFEIRVPDRRSINPVSKTDWDGPGVMPDVAVKADDALEVAVKLAQRKLQEPLP